MGDLQPDACKRYGSQTCSSCPDYTCGDNTNEGIRILRADLATAIAERDEAREYAEEWRDASGLIGVHANGCEGDPGDVEPCHLAAYMREAEARLDAVRALPRRWRENAPSASGALDRFVCANELTAALGGNSGAKGR
jgi:hypothetical protein